MCAAAIPSSSAVDFDIGQINNDRTGGVRRGGFEMDGSFTGDAFADFLLGLPTAGRARRRFGPR